jgi:hypothetical protein
VSPPGRIWLRLLAIAAPLSFGWEMLQAPGFTGMPRGWAAGTAVCALAALGDTVILLSLFGLGWLAFRNARWFVPPRLGPYALVVLASVTVQVPLEWLMVHRFGRWATARSSPSCRSWMLDCSRSCRPWQCHRSPSGCLRAGSRPRRRPLSREGNGA